MKTFMHNIIFTFLSFFNTLIKLINKIRYLLFYILITINNTTIT